MHDSNDTPATDTGRAGDVWLATLVVLTVAATVALAAALRLSFPAGDWLQPLLIVGVLVAVGAYYRRRGEAAFVLALEAIAVLVAFSSAFAVLTYAVAATARPWADGQLAAFDAGWGFHAPDIIGPNRPAALAGELAMDRLFLGDPPDRVGRRLAGPHEPAAARWIGS